MELVCTLDEFKPGEAKRVVVDGTPIAVFNLNGTFLALDDICSHALASLSEGYIEDDRVECPKHGSEFDLRTGEPRSLPATKPVRTHKVIVKDDAIYVEV
jgi:3-phenylpropionate/trans-cinnamate dioxygenase ferredoxin component